MTSCRPPPQITQLCRRCGRSAGTIQYVMLKAYHTDLSIHRCCSHFSVLVLSLLAFPPHFTFSSIQSQKQKEQGFFLSCSMICHRCRARCRMNKEKSSRDCDKAQNVSQESSSCFRGWLIMFAEPDVCDAVTYSVFFFF